MANVTLLNVKLVFNIIKLKLLFPHRTYKTSVGNIDIKSAYRNKNTNRIVKPAIML